LERIKKQVSDNGLVGRSLRDSSGIILITGAGGAFGAVLKAAQIGDLVGNSLAKTNLGVVIPIIVAAGIKTAQGSSTVAMITTAAIVENLLPSLGLTDAISKALLVIGIGGGSLLFCHVNDSLFWVVNKYAKLSIIDTFIVFSLGAACVGICSSVLVVIFHVSLIAGGVMCGVAFLFNVGLILYYRLFFNPKEHNQETEQLLPNTKGKNKN